MEQARLRVKATLNFTMVELYWSMGHRIVAEEQGGESRAAYGKVLLKQLAEQLTAEYGKGFDRIKLGSTVFFVKCIMKMRANGI